MIVQMIPDPMLLVIVDYLLYLILVKHGFKKITTTGMAKEVIIEKK